MTDAQAIDRIAAILCAPHPPGCENAADADAATVDAVVRIIDAVRESVDDGWYRVYVPRA